VAATFRSASSNNGGSSTTQSFPVTLPTGWAAGDLVLVVINVGAITTSLDTLAGWTQDHANDFNNGGNAHSTTVYYRIMQSGDTNPTFTNSLGSGKWAWAATAIQPGAGETISIDSQSSVLIQNGGTNSFTPNSATATTTDCSVLLIGVRSAVNGATAVDVTPPTGWTEGSESSTAVGTQSAVRQIEASVDYQNNVSAGTVAPGSASVNVSLSCQNAYHYLITSSGGAAGPVRNRLLVPQAVKRSYFY
jgi:hypothetical protein